MGDLGVAQSAQGKWWVSSLGVPGCTQVHPSPLPIRSIAMRELYPSHPTISTLYTQKISHSRSMSAAQTAGYDFKSSLELQGSAQKVRRLSGHQLDAQFMVIRIILNFLIRQAWLPGSP